ncbi:unnamed protein product [Strongylus vulgaris]|uniref:Uncharacterized protein n=1 Tax=Strongylus vulgaris TaxID=40348 RepID=A0A3P7IFV4_STRVU|nr:unnamed protein product [Strongylus vulgaris]
MPNVKNVVFCLTDFPFIAKVKKNARRKGRSYTAYGQKWEEIHENNVRIVLASSALPTFMSHDLALSELKFDFNEPYSKVRLLPLLHLAKIALLDQTHLIGSCSHARLLAFKVLLLWQKILREPCTALRDRMDNIAEKIDFSELDHEEEVQYWLERANAHLIYYSYEKCSECIKRALEISGLNMELAGKMGKRTRFQKNDIAQLVLNTVNILSRFLI